MPGGDRTGPAGMGPMTGRAAGYCAGYPVPGFANPVPGRGLGWGWGRGPGWGWSRGGRGWRNWYRATGLTGWQRAAGGYPAWGGPTAPPVPTAAVEPTAQQELQMLKDQAQYFQDTLEGIRKRIDELEHAPSSEK